MALNASKIVSVALELLNEVGLEGLSTRKLAAELSVKGPALYKHFENKADLLDQMASSLLTGAFESLDTNVSWEQWLRSIAYASNRSISKYKDGARLLILSSPNTQRRLKLVKFVSQPLIDAGFTEADAKHAAAVMASFVVGWSQNESNIKTRKLMKVNFYGATQGFDDGVKIIIDGLKFKLRSQKELNESD